MNLQRFLDFIKREQSRGLQPFALGVSMCIVIAASGALVVNPGATSASDVAAGGSQSADVLSGEALPLSEGTAGGPGGTGAGSASASGGGGDSAGSSGQNGPGSGAASGVAAGGEFKIGFYFTDTGPSIPGISGLAAGDGEGQANALLDYINARGGFGGRKASMVTYGVSIAEFGAAEDQASCAKFTQDNKVSFALNSGVHGPTWVDCLAGRQVTVVESLLVNNPDVATMRKYRGFLYQTTPSADRIGPTLAENLARRGYLKETTGGKTLGILWNSTNVYNKTIKDAFLARAKALGFPVAADNVVATDNSNAQNQNAIIKHRTNGVTHTVSIGATYGQAQDSQQYYPRLAILKMPLPLIALNASSRALRRSITIGYSPSWDVESAQEGATNKETQLCHQIMRERGHAPFSNRVAEGQARQACVSFFWLRDVANKARDLGLDILKPENVRKAVEALPARESSHHFTEVYGFNRYDGSETYKDVVYDESCSCWKYEGGLRQFYQQQPAVY